MIMPIPEEPHKQNAAGRQGVANVLKVSSSCFIFSSCCLLSSPNLSSELSRLFLICTPFSHPDTTLGHQSAPDASEEKTNRDWHEL